MALGVFSAALWAGLGVWHQPYRVWTNQKSEDAFPFTFAMQWFFQSKQTGSHKRFDSLRQISLSAAFSNFQGLTAAESAPEKFTCQENDFLTSGSTRQHVRLISLANQSFFFFWAVGGSQEFLCHQKLTVEQKHFIWLILGKRRWMAVPTFPTTQRVRWVSRNKNETQLLFNHRSSFVWISTYVSTGERRKRRVSWYALSPVRNDPFLALNSLKGHIYRPRNIEGKIISSGLSTLIWRDWQSNSGEGKIEMRLMEKNNTSINWWVLITFGTLSTWIKEE